MALSGNEKLEVIVREHQWTSKALTVIAFLCQQIGLNHIDTADLGTKDLTVLQVFLSSAPLVVAWAILYVLFIRDWRGSNQFGSNYSVQKTLFQALLLLGAAAFIGNALGFPQVEISRIFSAGDWRKMLIWLLGGYWTAYGITAFLSSIVVGIFGGRTFLLLDES